MLFRDAGKGLLSVEELLETGLLERCVNVPDCVGAIEVVP